MNYFETIDYLYSQLPVFQRVGGSAYKEGLDNSLALDKLLNHPHKKYKTIHVAGTNGKGSTSHLLAAVLQSAGYKVGLYTSPHLLDFRERIRVNGTMIEKDYVVDFVEQMKPVVEDIKPSFFELTMMMAFAYFAEQQVDIAIIEVGLGGRLDSTNIIMPDLSIITNISFDHTAFLGNTLPLIAAEKAGIIKPEIPVVIGEAGDLSVRNVFEEKAKELNSPVVFAEDDSPVRSVKRDQSGNLIIASDEYPELTLTLKGNYQEKNANTVLTSIKVLKSLHYQIPDQAVYDGFQYVMELTGLQGRWQIIQKNPKVICDTGHNVAGIASVVKQLQAEKYNQLRIVFGMVNDKDITHVIALLPKDAVYYFTKASVIRALDENELAKMAKEEGFYGKTFPMVKDAVCAALADASPDDLIFIGGSNFIVADAIEVFKLR